MELLCFPPKQTPDTPWDVEPSQQEASSPSQVSFQAPTFKTVGSCFVGCGCTMRTHGMV